MSCQCEQCAVAATPVITAGLSRLPRQLATFSDFRARMLCSAPNKTALSDWRAREDDRGLLLLDMWAYACDILAFYDEVIAHESYVRTARRDPSVRKLVGLIGYRPRPAVAASVALAVLAEGRRAVTVDAGATARSGAFDAEPPQRFESPSDATVHPLFNKWSLEAPRRTTVSAAGETTFTQLWLDPTTVRVKAGELLLISVVGDSTLTQIRRVSSVETVTADDGDDYAQVTLEAAVTLNATLAANVRLWRVSERIGLWSIEASESSNPAAVQEVGGVAVLTLDGVYRQVRRNDTVLVSNDGVYRWFKVTDVTERTMEVVAATSVTVNAVDDDFDSTVSVPAVHATATQFTLDSSLNVASRGEDPAAAAATWSASSASTMLVHYGLTEVGRVVVPANPSVVSTDVLRLQAPIEQPTDADGPTRFVLVDKNGLSVDANGTLDYATRALTLTGTDEWTEPLVLPVDVYGNVIDASRGETVASEILGSGDGSVASQEFVLKKYPLTYLPVTLPDGTPYSSTLEVRVDDVLWTEVKSFYGVAANATVYIVREDDDGKSHVTFGDGVRGRQLPSGRDNIRAAYRFGGGASAPPADSVTQMAAPVAGVKRWWNAQPAYGGDDAESSSRVRQWAPRSALTLGRAVSLADIGAVAGSVGGARAVRAEWCWDGTQQRPVARVWYIGLPGVDDSITDALGSVCDQSVPIDVRQATGLATELLIDLEIDDAYDTAVVAAAVLATLMADLTGMLVPERIGIGRPLIRSRLFEAILSVAGIIAVRGLLLDGASVADAAADPGEGQYFDFETGTVSVNGVTA